MSQTNMQRAYQLLIFGLLIGLSVSRPNGSVESQETSENQLSVSDIEKSYPGYYRPMPTLQYYTYDEPNALDRYHLQYRPYYSSSQFRGDSYGGGSGNANYPIWDPYRQLVSKRQTRYRQCYFNPISCFRK